MRGAHFHATTVAGSSAELDGHRLRYAGGNGALDVLWGSSGSPVAPPTPAAQIGASVPSSGGLPVTVANTSGGQTSLPRVQTCIVALVVVSVAILVMFDRLGLKFSATVG